MAADGTDQRPLTALPGTEGAPDSPAAARHVAGPDSGRRITVTSDCAGGGRRAVSSSAAFVAPCGRAEPADAASQGPRRPDRLLEAVPAERPPAARSRHGREAAARGKRHCRARSRTLRAAGTAKLAIRLTRRARARIATVKRARLTLRITASADGKRQSTQRRVTFTRTAPRCAPDLSAGATARTSNGGASTMPPARKPAKRRSKARAHRSPVPWPPRLPVLEQRHLDLIGLGLVAVGVFLAFPLYLRWEGVRPARRSSTGSRGRSAASRGRRRWRSWPPASCSSCAPRSRRACGPSARARCASWGAACLGLAVGTFGLGPGDGAPVAERGGHLGQVMADG